MGLTGNATEKTVHQALVEQSHLPMAQVEGTGHVVSTVNAAFCRLLGKSAKDLIGKRFAELVPLGVECLELVDDVYRTGEARSRVRAREDQLDPVYWSYTCLPIKGESNKPLGVVVQVTETPLFNAQHAEINQALLVSSVKQHELIAEAERLNEELQCEISEHQQAEVLLRKNRDTFFSLIEKAPFGLYVVDSHFRLQHVSSGAEHVFSRIDPHIGQDFSEVLRQVWSEPFVGKAIEHFRHTLRTGEPYAEKELTEQRLDIDTLESYDWRIERITLPDGQYGVVCYFYDISEQKKARILLQEADRRKSEFLATLAHELRNPLAPLRNGLELLALSQGDVTTWDQTRGMMKRQIDQMVRLIDELLDLSRITRGSVDLQLVRLDLRAVLDQALETCRPLLDQQEHTLTVELPQGSLIVEGDSMRLSQVFTNLLNNAAKYTDRGGTITLKAWTDGTMVNVSISDSGIGIAREDLERVFDMFAQVQRADDRSQGGLGIGLNIAKHVVEMHGGRIAVRSTGLHQGSSFTVQLPLSLLPVTRPTSATSKKPRASVVSKRVLIVDDNQDAASMMALVMGKWGHEIHVANDGQAALELGARVKPEIVLMDIGMPVMDGHVACEHMRQTEWGRKALIVALTGWGQEEDTRRSEQAGFDHHLVKPISSEVLLNVFAMATTPRSDN
jgi:signal transduction histidine kinase/ActR/RegA family two-component response regulator